MGVVQWFGNKVFVEVERDMKGRVRECLEEIAKEARWRCPEVTGTLKNSIRVVYFSGTRSPSGIVIAGDEEAWYAPKVELGHRSVSGEQVDANPFLRNAFKSVVKRKKRKFFGPR